MAKRFLKTAVVSALFALTLAVSASAASAGGATTTTAVNFRTGAGTNYGIISTLPAGTHVVVSSQSSGGWATVVYNGTVGYISSDYLKRANDMDASFGTGTIDGSYVRMRSGASTSSSILGTYNSGTTMTVTGVSGAWYKVSYNGTAGYVHSDYVSLSGVTSNGGSTAGSNGSVKGSDVRMRSGPGTNYSILGTYQNGTPLTVTGTENGWSKVTVGGMSGYIRSDYVSGGGADSKTGYIKGTGVRMRSGASTTSSILGVYNTGTEMTITGESGNWYKVSYSGKDGYVCKDYMTTTKPDNGGGSASQTGYIKGNDVRLRSGAHELFHPRHVQQRHAADYHRHERQLDGRHHQRRQGLCQQHVCHHHEVGRRQYRRRQHAQRLHRRDHRRHGQAVHGCAVCLRRYEPLGL